MNCKICGHDETSHGYSNPLCLITGCECRGYKK